MIDNINKIKNLIKEKNLSERFIIAIDGPCAGGKSTFAEVLKKELTANVVHMDDFYLPFKDRSNTWTTTIAGHMDYDRLKNNVIIPYVENIETNYISYDCHNDKYMQKIDIDLTKPLILEGSYSQNPYSDINKYIDLKIFVDIERGEQLKRLKKRNEKTVKMFESMWIPFENRYFDEYKIKDLSDIVINV